ncbi:MAG: prolyl oligopeptidase family serine peptidase [Pseudomonadota bacterium]
MTRAFFLIVLSFLLSAPLAFSEDTAEGMSPRDFLSIHHLNNPSLSPDGAYLMYQRSSTLWSKNEKIDRYRMIELETGERLPVPKPKRDTLTVGSISWHPDSSGYIYLRRPVGQRDRQAYFFNIDNGQSEQLTDHEAGIGFVIWARDGSGFFFGTEEEDAPATGEKAIKDAWEIQAFDEPKDREIWYFDLATEQSKAIISGDFTVRAASLSRDGTRLIYSRAPDQRLNSGYLREVHVHNLETGDDRAWTSNDYAEGTVRLSPDNRSIAYIATVNQDGEPYYEDKVFIQRKGKKPRRLLSDMAFEALEVEWDQSGKGLFILGNTGLRTALYRYDVKANTLTALTHGDQVISDWRYDPIQNAHTAKITDAGNPGELYIWRAGASGFEPLTEEYANWQDKFLLPRQEAVTWTARDGTLIEGLLVYPLGYEDGTRYPLVTTTHGGPRSSSQFGSWNTSRYVPVLAAQGYMIFLPNHRGGTGYGDAFMRDMFGGYFRNAHLDVMDGIDALIERGLADPDRLIKMGWSAGGHMVNRLITETDRFKAASSGAGAADWISMHGESDVRRGRDFMFGGSPWEKDAPRDQYLADSPLKDVWKVTTPTLFFVGERDVRVPPTQSILMFRGVQETGTETKLYQAPGEPHNFRKPAHQLFKINTELAWYARWLQADKHEFDLPKNAFADEHEEDGWTLDESSARPSND